jgi:hypothetical protein
MYIVDSGIFGDKKNVAWIFFLLGSVQVGIYRKDLKSTTIVGCRLPQCYPISLNGGCS